ncbi:hypothetical protein H1Q78_07140 [Cellulosimicrobium cellulans]|nr:hypothetical protein [Cellulosimicrobium cellulans]UKJ62223.1 hypothetical protein H1Q78_07140 [Cellulosimicrobium cellulans]
MLVITDDNVDWVYAPCDGGADVIAPTVKARDALSERFSTWLSPRADGL